MELFDGEYTGRDLKVEQAWLQGVTGCNVTVAVVDDGNIRILQYLLYYTLTAGTDFNHPDLWPNFVSLTQQAAI